MPQIPFVQSERTLPGTAGGNFLPSENPVNEAVIRGGQQVAGTASQFMTSLTQQKQWEEAQRRQYDERMRRATQHVEAAKHENYLKDWMGQKVEKLRGRVDYENFDAQAEADVQELQGYIDKIDDIEVRMAVEAGAQPILHSLNSQYKVKKAAVLTDVGKAELDRSLDRDRKEWVQATSESDPVMQTQVDEDGLVIKPTERDIIKARMQARIQASLDAGILKPTEAVNMAQTLDAGLEEAYVRELINTAPDRAVKELGDSKALNALNPNQKQQLLHAADVQARQRREEGKAEERRQKVSAVGIELTQSFALDGPTPNWEGAIKELYKPDNLTRWGIIFQESQQIFSDLHARWTLEQQQVKLKKKQAEDDLKNAAYELANKGKFKEAFDLLDKSKLDPQDIYDSKQKIVTDLREDARYKEWLSRDNAEKVQKKAEKWLMNNVKADQAGFALQSYRAGLMQFEIGPDRYEEYARTISAMPQYSKKTNAAAKLANALGQSQSGGVPQNQALKPTPMSVFRDMGAKIKSGELTRKQAEEKTMAMGYDPDKLEEQAKPKEQPKPGPSKQSRNPMAGLPPVELPKVRW